MHRRRQLIRFYGYLKNITFHPDRLAWLLIFVLLVSGTIWLARSSASSEPASTMPTDRPLKMMTFNIRHAEGGDGKVALNRIADLLKETGADVIALQEVDRYWPRSGFKDQVRELAGRLHMQWRFVSSLGQGKREYGNAILSRFPIEHSESIRLPGKRESRSMLETSIKVGDGSIRVVTLHLGVGLADRHAQMPLLLDRIASYTGPTVLMGDWNMSAEDPLLIPLSSHWSRLRLPTHEATVENGRQIDHIFVNFEAGNEHAWTRPSKASDHYPVLAYIERP